MPEGMFETAYNGRRGAVSLTFDDGTTNQLDNAVRRLDERDLRGTFYVNPRDRVMQEMADRWREVAYRGHEIGNHTLSHPCPSAITGGRGLEDMTLDELEADILNAQELLKSLAPHQDRWTFAYPCYATYVGRGPNRKSYVPIIAKHFLAGRAGGEVGFANRPGLLDLSALCAMPVERLQPAQVIDLIERLVGAGQWVILVYHDIDGPVLSVRRSEYEVVLDYLAENREEILTAPVRVVAEYMDLRIETR